MANISAESFLRVPSTSQNLTRTKLLPYADTLHYPGCGCPSIWTRGNRVCDLVDVLFTHCHELYTSKWLSPMRPLRVAYMLPHHNITGGMKCLVEHLRLLKQRGHTTIAVHRSDNAMTAMPPWTDVKADVDIVCNLSQRLNDVYPTQQIDVVVVGIFHQVAELLAGVSVPVVYWEQGHEWVFGDPIRLQSEQNYIKQDRLFHMCMHLPVPLVSVSTAIQDILFREFGRLSLVVPNGIDCEKFYPAEKLNSHSISDGSQTSIKCTKSVLLVGNPALPLKGFDYALRILIAVSKAIDIKVTWICQVKPTTTMLPILAHCDLDIDYVVAPSQNEIPNLYRGHDVFLFTSMYEAWGMPVLEAMASGLAVVTTDCFGVRSFATHGVNCLMAEPTDIKTLVQYVVKVCIDSSLNEALATNARASAKQFSLDRVADTLEAVLYSLTACSDELRRAKQASIPDLQVTYICAAEACSRSHRQS
eukprot:g3369.t1